MFWDLAAAQAHTQALAAQVQAQAQALAQAQAQGQLPRAPTAGAPAAAAPAAAAVPTLPHLGFQPPAAFAGTALPQGAVPSAPQQVLWPFQAAAVVPPSPCMQAAPPLPMQPRQAQMSNQQPPQASAQSAQLQQSSPLHQQPQQAGAAAAMPGLQVQAPAATSKPSVPVPPAPSSQRAPGMGGVAASSSSSSMMHPPASSARPAIPPGARPARPPQTTMQRRPLTAQQKEIRDADYRARRRAVLQASEDSQEASDSALTAAKRLAEVAKEAKMALDKAKAAADMRDKARTMRAPQSQQLSSMVWDAASGSWVQVAPENAFHQKQALLLEEAQRKFAESLGSAGQVTTAAEAALAAAKKAAEKVLAAAVPLEALARKSESVVKLEKVRNSTQQAETSSQRANSSLATAKQRTQTARDEKDARALVSACQALESALFQANMSASSLTQAAQHIKECQADAGAAGLVGSLSSKAGQETTAMPGPSRDLLPIDEYRDQIVLAIKERPVVCIRGEAGCGKSCRVPQYIYHYCRGAAAYLRSGEGERTILCIQSSSLAAIALAERVAIEMGESAAGGLVGYRTQAGSRADQKATKILFVPANYFLRTLVDDPAHIRKFSHIVLDEVHERTIDVDMLALVLKLQLQHKAADFKMVVMSASLQDNFAEYFHIGGKHRTPPSPMFTGPQRYSMDVLYLEDLQSFSTFMKSTDSAATIYDEFRKRSALAVDAEGMKALQEALSTFEHLAWLAQQPLKAGSLQRLAVGGLLGGEAETQFWRENVDLVPRSMATKAPQVFMKAQVLAGLEKLTVQLIKVLAIPGESILIFLPGLSEVTSMRRTLHCLEAKGALKAGGKPFAAKILEMHDGLCMADQRAVLSTPPDGICQIILAAGLVSSSVTLPKLRIVIDFCLHRSPLHDQNRRALDFPITRWVSQATATHRAGRVSRLFPGVVIRMVSNIFFSSVLPDLEEACLLEAPLEVPFLRSCFLARRLQETMPRLGSLTARKLLRLAPEPPPPEHIEEAVAALMELGAVTGRSDEQLRMTVLGRLALALPLPLRLSRLVLFGVLFGCAADAVVMAAALSVPNPFQRPLRQQSKDHAEHIQAVLKASEARREFDQGSLSEPVMLRNLFAAWLQDLVTRTPKPAEDSGKDKEKAGDLVSELLPNAKAFASVQPVDAQSLALLGATTLEVARRTLELIRAPSAEAGAETSRPASWARSSLEKLVEGIGLGLSQAQAESSAATALLGVSDTSSRSEAIDAIFCQDLMMLKVAVAAAFTPFLAHGLVRCVDHRPLTSRLASLPGEKVVLDAEPSLAKLRDQLLASTDGKADAAAFAADPRCWFCIPKASEALQRNKEALTKSLQPFTSCGTSTLKELKVVDKQIFPCFEVKESDVGSALEEEPPSDDPYVPPEELLMVASEEEPEPEEEEEEQEEHRHDADQEEEEEEAEEEADKEDRSTKKKQKKRKRSDDSESRAKSRRKHSKEDKAAREMAADVALRLADPAPPKEEGGALDAETEMERQLAKQGSSTGKLAQLADHAHTDTGGGKESVKDRKTKTKKKGKRSTSRGRKKSGGRGRKRSTRSNSSQRSRRERSRSRSGEARPGLPLDAQDISLAAAAAAAALNASSGAATSDASKEDQETPLARLLRGAATDDDSQKQHSVNTVFVKMTEAEKERRRKKIQQILASKQLNLEAATDAKNSVLAKLKAKAEKAKKRAEAAEAAAAAAANGEKTVEVIAIEDEEEDEAEGETKDSTIDLIDQLLQEQLKDAAEQKSSEQKAKSEGTSTPGGSTSGEVMDLLSDSSDDSDDSVEEQTDEAAVAKKDLDLGEEVEAHGLEEEGLTDLNGQGGVIARVIEETGELEVRFGKDRLVALKPENLRRASGRLARKEQRAKAVAEKEKAKAASEELVKMEEAAEEFFNELRQMEQLASMRAAKKKGSAAAKEEKTSEEASAPKSPSASAGPSKGEDDVEMEDAEKESKAEQEDAKQASKDEDGAKAETEAGKVSSKATSEEAGKEKAKGDVKEKEKTEEITKGKEEEEDKKETQKEDREETKIETKEEEEGVAGETVALDEEAKVDKAAEKEEAETKEPPKNEAASVPKDPLDDELAAFLEEIGDIEAPPAAPAAPATNADGGSAPAAAGAEAAAAQPSAGALGTATAAASSEAQGAATTVTAAASAAQPTPTVPAPEPKASEDFAFEAFLQEINDMPIDSTALAEAPPADAAICQQGLQELKLPTTAERPLALCFMAARAAWVVGCFGKPNKEFSIFASGPLAARQRALEYCQAQLQEQDQQPMDTTTATAQTPRYPIGLPFQTLHLLYQCANGQESIPWTVRESEKKDVSGELSLPLHPFQLHWRVCLSRGGEPAPKASLACRPTFASADCWNPGSLVVSCPPKALVAKLRQPPQALSGEQPSSSSPSSSSSSSVDPHLTRPCEQLGVYCGVRAHDDFGARSGPASLQGFTVLPDDDGSHALPMLLLLAFMRPRACGNGARRGGGCSALCDLDNLSVRALSLFGSVDVPGRWVLPLSRRQRLTLHDLKRANEVRLAISRAINESAREAAEGISGQWLLDAEPDVAKALATMISDIGREPPDFECCQDNLDGVTKAVTSAGGGGTTAAATGSAAALATQGGSGDDAKMEVAVAEASAESPLPPAAPSGARQFGDVWIDLEEAGGMWAEPLYREMPMSSKQQAVEPVVAEQGDPRAESAQFFSFDVSVEELEATRASTDAGSEAVEEPAPDLDETLPNEPKEFALLPALTLPEALNERAAQQRELQSEAKDVIRGTRQDAKAAGKHMKEIKLAATKVQQAVNLAQEAWDLGIDTNERAETTRAMEMATSAMKEVNSLITVINDAAKEVEQLAVAISERDDRAGQVVKTSPQFWTAAAKETAKAQEVVRGQADSIAAILEDVEGPKRRALRRADDTVKLVNEKLQRFADEERILREEAKTREQDRIEKAQQAAQQEMQRQKMEMQRHQQEMMQRRAAAIAWGRDAVQPMPSLIYSEGPQAPPVPPPADVAPPPPLPPDDPQLPTVPPGPPGVDLPSAGARGAENAQHYP